MIRTCRLLLWICPCAMVCTSFRGRASSVGGASLGGGARCKKLWSVKQIDGWRGKISRGRGSNAEKSSPPKQRHGRARRDASRRRERAEASGVSRLRPPPFSRTHHSGKHVFGMLIIVCYGLSIGTTMVYQSTHITCTLPK